MTGELRDLDPFDLPDWLGEGDVTWEATSGLRSGHLVPGVLSAGGEELPCDLMAVDEAFPRPVAADELRTRCHQAWHHGQVLMVEREGRLTLLVPSRCFDAELAIDALARLARAVGGTPERYALRLRIGGERR